MQAFATLLDRLVLTPSRNGKLRLLVDYFRAQPDPDRGYALAVIAGDLSIASVKPAMLRALAVERMDEVLFGYSYDYVGDLAETIALVWPAPDEHAPPPHLHEVIEALAAASRLEGPRIVERLLDRLDSSGRYALLKIVTGALRMGVTARLAKQALARLGEKDVIEIEEIWHGLVPPYVEFFAWLEGRGERPVSAALAPFRPVMLAQALDETDFPKLAAGDYAAEWKWDGIRVQAVSEGGVRRLYSRTGDDISGAFPDILDFLDYDGAIDGELLVGREADGAITVAPFGDLQQRLNRKVVSPKLVRSHPAFIRAYDLLARRRRRSAAACLRRAAQASRSSCRRAPVLAHRPLAPRRLRGLGASCPASSAPAGGWAHPRSGRGPDAEALGFRLCAGTAEGSVVQMEARPAYR